MSSPLQFGLTRSPGRPVITRHPSHQVKGATKPPHFVARGDSWFAFKEAVALPAFKPANLAEAIQELGYSIDIVAANGATAIEMSSDSKLAKLSAELISARADALLFSGGGDGLFVQGGYPPASPASAFEWFLQPAGAGCLNPKRFDRFLGDLYTAIQRIADVATQCGLPCFLHTYAVPIPSGRAAYPYPRCGPWIRPVLIKRGYNPDRDGLAILTTISDRFCELLHDVHGACVEVVDLVPIVRKSDWRDELHLRAAGWQRCAREFQRVFQTIPLLATLVEPVERRQLPQPARELISQQRTVAA
jgi:hypothetical protein